MKPKTHSLGASSVLAGKKTRAARSEIICPGHRSRKDGGIQSQTCGNSDSDTKNDSGTRECKEWRREKGEEGRNKGHGAELAALPW